MNGYSETGEDLLSMRLSLGSACHHEPTKKRKRTDEACCNRGSPAVDGNGLQLLRLLLICATSIDRNDPNSAVESLRRLYRSISFSGDPINRVTAYFTEGLTARFISRNPPFLHDPSPDNEFAAFTAFYRASPYYQFAHFTANQAIIEAFEEEELYNDGCLHVVDLDVSYGFQWPSLIQSLSDKATRDKPISLRITGFGPSAAELKDTEMRLSSFARGCQNLLFEFEGRLRGEMGYDEEEIIRLRKNETVAVNTVFYLSMLRNYSEVCGALMQMHALNPSVVTLVEKEGSKGGEKGFLLRFMESLHYFSAMFDSLDDCLPSESKERLRIEKHHLGKEIRNSVMVEREGEKSLMRYERLETWRAVMERNRYEGVRMSSRSVSQAKLLLKSHCSAMGEHGTGTGFRISVRDEGKGISLGWQQKHLITASSWRPLLADHINA